MEEITRLFDDKFIRSCLYMKWVASTMPVEKKNGKLQICIDFRDINKAAPKDECWMLITDLLVDAAFG
jgi:hypothetical protein